MWSTSKEREKKELLSGLQEEADFERYRVEGGGEGGRKRRNMESTARLRSWRMPLAQGEP